MNDALWRPNREEGDVEEREREGREREREERKKRTKVFFSEKNEVGGEKRRFSPSFKKKTTRPGKKAVFLPFPPRDESVIVLVSPLVPRAAAQLLQTGR